jgi:hypothetical protein
MAYIARFARQNRAPSPTSPELTTRISQSDKARSQALRWEMLQIAEYGFL